MRYALAALLTFGIGITAAIPAALAENNSGRGCYKDGVAFNCTLPAPVYLGTGPSMGLVPGTGHVREIHRATSMSQPLLSPADSGFSTLPPNSPPGYTTGYGNVVEPSQPLWVVQFPL
jgi:hypothetical protein